MKTVSFLVVVLYCIPSFSQDLLVELTDDEHDSVYELDDANAIFLNQILSGQKIAILKGSSSVGSVGYIYSLNNRNRNKSRGSRTAENKSKIGIVIDKVIDENNAIANNNRWWLEGFDTNTWNEGKKESDSLRDVIVIKHEGKTWITDSGKTRNVQHYIKVDIEPAEQLIEYILEDRGLHLFFDKKRQKRHIGTFLELEKESVSIKTIKGRTIRVPVKNLSMADQEWIKYQ